MDTNIDISDSLPTNASAATSDNVENQYDVHDGVTGNDSLSTRKLKTKTKKNKDGDQEKMKKNKKNKNNKDGDQEKMKKKNKNNKNKSQNTTSIETQKHKKKKLKSGKHGKKTKHHGEVEDATVDPSHKEKHKSTLNTDIPTTTTTMDKSNNDSSQSFRVSFDGSLSPVSSTTCSKEGGYISTGKHSTKIDEELGQGASVQLSLGTNPKIMRQSYCTRRKGICVSISLLVFLAVTAVAAVLCYFFLIVPQEDSTSYTDYPSIYSVSKDTVLSDTPQVVCNEWVPGQGKSKVCRATETKKHGGQLCNLVAKSMLSANVEADIALINAGVCVQDLIPPELTVDDIYQSIIAHHLTIVEIAGTDIVKLLKEAVFAAFGESGETSYPYSSGLRYHIEANLAPDKIVSEVEVNPGLNGSWEAIDERKYYNVVTTTELAFGGMGYSSFAHVIDAWKTNLGFQTVDTLYNFVKDTADWWVLPEEQYSTQVFAAVDDDLTLATVPYRICHALAPGEPENQLCSAVDVSDGNLVCSLVAWSLYDQIFGVDMVLLKGGICRSDIPPGNFGVQTADTVLAQNPSLVTIRLSGRQIRITIEEGISVAMDLGIVDDFPAAAGLRFDLDTKQGVGDRTSNMEIITPTGSWEQLSDTKIYTVVTSPDVARGEDPNYQTISQADTSSIQNLYTTVKDEFVQYATEWKTLYRPPKEKICTQSFA
jgi:hypothetical protein